MKLTIAAMVAGLSIVTLWAAQAPPIPPPQDTVTVEGQELVLNGKGIRKKALVGDVYVGSLYVAEPSHDAQAILAADAPRAVELQMLRDLSRGRITDSVEENFEKNAGDRVPALRERLDRFIAVVPDVKKGEKLTISYAPGVGTTLSSDDGRSVTIEGKDFADAMFGVWLGEHSVDESLKRGMLGLPRE